MKVVFKHFDSKFKKNLNPKIGLLVLSTDQTIEGDFNKIFKNLPLDIFINRIHNPNPLTKENLLKMQSDLELATNKILPDEKINTIAYGCTSGTIVIGEKKVKEKILLAKPDCYVTSRVCDNEWTIEWLKKYNFPIKKVITIQDNASKVETLKNENIVWFVDDRWDNFTEINNSGLCCFLMDAHHNQRYDAGYKRIKKLEDLLCFQ